MLTSLGTGVGYLKAGFLGFNKSGKTYTAKELAIGVRDHFKLEGPIAMLDTEGGAQYIAPDVKKRTGKDLIGAQTRALDEAVAFVKECETSGVSVAIVDSVTHLWREVCDSYLKQVNEARAKLNKNPRTRLEFQDWGPIKDRWAKFSNAYLNSKLHIIICGRAGFEYDYQDISGDGDGKKELVKTGVKMKTEGEFGYEPSLLVEMERVQRDSAGRVEGRITHRATVIGDRFGVIDGKEQDNPTFEFFKPHVSLLIPGAHVAVDTEKQSKLPIDESGDAEWNRERRQRAIFAEEIQGALTAAWPGQSAPEKACKIEVIYRIFATRSWTAVENMESTRLRDGCAKISAEVEKLKAEAAADAKANEKPEKAEKPVPAAAGKGK